MKQHHDDSGVLDSSRPQTARPAIQASSHTNNAPTPRGALCTCGAVIYNGHHCENGHIQARD